MGAPKTPKVRSADKVADTQFRYGKQAQGANIAANRIDQQGPFGGVGYQLAGVDAQGNPQYSAETFLTPEQQQIVQALQGTIGNQAQAIQANYTGLPEDYINDATSGTVQQGMERQLAFMQPFINQGQENLDNQLRNQGLMPGTQAYDRAMHSLRTTNFQNVGKFLNEFQPQAHAQAVQRYQLPMQTISGLMNTALSTDPSSRLIRPYEATMGTPDYVGANTAENQANMQAYQAKLAQHNAMLTGIMGIGTGLVGAPNGSFGANMMSGLFS